MQSWQKSTLVILDSVPCKDPDSIYHKTMPMSIVKGIIITLYCNTSLIPTKLICWFIPQCMILCQVVVFFAEWGEGGRSDEWDRSAWNLPSPCSASPASVPRPPHCAETKLWDWFKAASLPSRQQVQTRWFGLHFHEVHCWCTTHDNTVNCQFMLSLFASFR